MIDALASAEYKVEDGDTLISIAKKFNLDPKALVKFNHIKSNTAHTYRKNYQASTSLCFGSKRKKLNKKR